MKFALLLFVGVVTAQAASPVANNDFYATPANALLTVPAPGVLGNDTDADFDTLTVSPTNNQFSFAGFVFDQASTPTTFAVLPAGVVSGGFGVSNTAAPIAVTLGITGFPDSQTGFVGDRSIGRFFERSSGNTAKALNLPAGNNGITARSGFELSWTNGLALTNVAGASEFVIYESGSVGAPEAEMVQVHDAVNNVWTRWVYQRASTNVAVTGGVLFATAFDLSDFGIAIGGRVDRFRVVNMIDADRMDSASGVGFVQPAETIPASAFRPDPGPEAVGFSQYGAATLDPDPAYLGILQVLVPVTNAFNTVSALGASVGVGTNGNFTYDPRNAAALQSLAPGATTVDSFTYTVTDGTGNFATATVNITVTGTFDPPVVTLTNPTNNSTFVAPVNITLDATASGVDGAVTNVQFYAGATLLGADDTAPYTLTWSNVPPALYQLTAVATDNLGLSSTSSIVNITVLSGPPASETSAANTNSVTYRQSGLLTQVVRITNPTAQTFAAVRVNITALPAGVTVYNATGTNAGVPFVQYNLPLLPGAFIDLTIEYYVPLRNVIPNPVLVTELVSPLLAPAPAGTAQAIDRSLVLVDGSYLIDFSTLAGRTYFIQYRTTLGDPWKTAVPAIVGTGSRVQWIDNGPPKTDAHPSTVASRFYQVILLP